MKNSPKVPNHLSAEGKRMWLTLRADYEIKDSGGVVVLTSACEAFDRLRQAQKILRSDGLTITDRFGQVKAHPMTITERDCRSQMLLALKALALDLEPLNATTGRPPSSLGWKGFEDADEA